MAACGFFALNGGKWPGNPGLAHYFTPDTRIWEPMGLCYSEFVEWAISDQAISVYPPIGFQGEDGAKIPIAHRDRRPIQAREVWTFSNDIAKQLGGMAAGQ